MVPPARARLHGGEGICLPQALPQACAERLCMIRPASAQHVFSSAPLHCTKDHSNPICSIVASPRSIVARIGSRIIALPPQSGSGNLSGRTHALQKTPAMSLERSQLRMQQADGEECIGLVFKPRQACLCKACASEASRRQGKEWVRARGYGERGGRR